ncbi:GSCOCG00001913001-RA-CDS [Cotesia congregata]|nr:GSCOCG00001913001-RA-CDS [Cotesia congregata]
MDPNSDKKCVISINEKNIEGIIESNEVVVINFYANWCRFSQQLEPIYEEACKEVRNLHPEPSKVVMGSVDVETERALGQKFNIWVYPTIKFIVNGRTMKRQYPGKRISPRSSDRNYSIRGIY